MKYVIEITPNVKVTVIEGIAFCENEVVEEQANSLLQKYSQEKIFSHPDAAKAYALAMHFGTGEIEFEEE